MNAVTNNVSLINNKRAANSDKLKRNNLFGLGFVSLIAACGGDEAGSTALTDDTSALDKEAIQARIDAAVRAAILKTQNDLEREAEEAAQAERDAEADRLAEEATYTPTSEFTGITRITTNDGAYSNLRVSWSEQGFVTNLPIFDAEFIADPAPGGAPAANKGKASIHNLGGDATKIDLLVNIPTFDGDDCGAENRGLVAVYWDIQYGFDLNSKHLRILGESKDDEIGDEGVSFYHIGGIANFNQLDMIISSSLVDNGDTRPDAGAIYIIWDFDRYNGASKTIDLATDTGPDSGILAIRGGYRYNHIGNSKKTIATVNNDEKLDLILEAPDAAGGKGGLFIFWDIAKAEYRDGKNINLLNTAPGIFKIYGGSTAKNLGEEGSGRGFIFKESSTSNKMMLRDFDHKGTHDLVFYDGSHTYLLSGESFMGSNKFVDLGLKSFQNGQVIDSGWSGNTTAFRVEGSGGYHYKVNRQYTDVTTFYNDIVTNSPRTSPIYNAYNDRLVGNPFGTTQAADKEFRPISEASTSASSAALSDVQEDGIWDIA